MSRHKQLKHLQDYMSEVDKDITMILQNLQWDRNILSKGSEMGICRYDTNHKVPINKLKEHEERCLFKCEGYTEADTLLPDLLDINMNTVVKLSSEKINEIINNAARSNPLFIKGRGSGGVEPMSAERLQATYTADERRAIHDAVAAALPAPPGLADFTVAGGGGDTEQGKQKTRLEELAALRDMRRRRTKYRVAAKTRNYSDVLRDVIRTQMEVFTETQTDTEENKKFTSQNIKNDVDKKTEINSRNYKSTNNEYRNEKRDRYKHRDLEIKHEKYIEHKDGMNSQRSRIESKHKRHYEDSHSSRDLKSDKTRNKNVKRSSSYSANERDGHSSSSYDRKSHVDEERHRSRRRERRDRNDEYNKNNDSYRYRKDYK